MELKLATCNINGIKSRLPKLLDWLAREQADVDIHNTRSRLEDALLQPESRGCYALGASVTRQAEKPAVSPRTRRRQAA